MKTILNFKIGDIVASINGPPDVCPLSSRWRIVDIAYCWTGHYYMCERINSKEVIQINFLEHELTFVERPKYRSIDER
jgi:hypothetical protein